MSSEPTDIEHVASCDSVPSTQVDSQAQLVSVLSAMQASMTQTNEYL